MSLPSPSTVGRYQLTSRLGQGSTGVVYEAHDPVLDRPVAIKLMLPDAALDVGSRERFLRDARAISRLRHRHIAAVYDVAGDGDQAYLAMELLRGTTLARRLTVAPALTLAESLDLVDQVCVGLHHAHEHGLLHRNLTPANIWLLDDGSVKLVDFGFHPAVAATVTDPRSAMGRMAYMSPELVAGRPADGHSDVYSAGVVLFELVTGRRPFEAQSITGLFQKVLHDAPAPLTRLPEKAAGPIEAVLSRALDKDPARRYPDALEMAADLTIARLALLDVPAAEPESAPAPVVAPPLPVSTGPSHDRMRHTVAPSEPAPFHDADLVFGDQPAPRVPSSRMPVLAGIGGALVVALAIVIGVWQARRPSAPTTQKETTAQPPAQPTAQAPPTPKPVAEVQIESQPADAELFLNGEALGVRTPTSLPADRVAGAEVRASKPGFEPAAVRVTRADIDRGRISLALVAEVPPTVVTGRAEFPFEVLRGSTVVSQRSDSHRFTVRGEQTLRISAPQVFLDRVVTVAPGRGTFNLNVPPLGRLSVRTAPSLERCRVSVGGLDFGTPPYPPIQYQPIVAGTHRVSLTCPDGSTRQELVVVEAARDRSVVIR